MNPIKIAIDCRMLKHSGIGTFIKGILDEIYQYPHQKFYLFGNEHDLAVYKDENVLIIPVDIPIFSFSEIAKYPSKIVNECDFFLVPNINIPGRIKIPVITVIHDVLFLDMPEILSNKLSYYVRRFFYKRAVKLSTKIITVSEFSRQRILHHFINKEVIIAYNGVPKDVIEFKNKVHLFQKKEYFVYVGNLKQHKGIITLITTFKKLGGDHKLLIVGSANKLKTADEKVKKLISEQNGLSNIEFTGYLKRDELLKVILEAKALIQPSLYEGFGLPPLEALVLGTNCILSDIEVFKEVYRNCEVDFFQTEDADQLYAILESFKPYSFDSVELQAKFSYKQTLATILSTMTK